MDVASIKVKAIDTQAESYDIFVEAIVLYRMGFTLDFLNQTMFHHLRWQIVDGEIAI